MQDQGHSGRGTKSGKFRLRWPNLGTPWVDWHRFQIPSFSFCWEEAVDLKAECCFFSFLPLNNLCLLKTKLKFGVLVMLSKHSTIRLPSSLITRVNLNSVEIPSIVIKQLQLSGSVISWYIIVFAAQHSVVTTPFDRFKLSTFFFLPRGKMSPERICDLQMVAQLLCCGTGFLRTQLETGLVSTPC